MIETLLGGIIGGAFRLAPEVLKLLDRRAERAHELAMQDKALEFERLRGTQRMAEIEAAWNTNAIEALKEAVAAQGKLTGVKWADALSASVRPIVTYMLVLLYAAVKIGAFTAAMQAGASWVDAIQAIWSEADQALLAGTLNFWFLGRVFDKALNK